MSSLLIPLTDRAGRFAPLKCAALAAVLAPALWIGISAFEGRLGSRPVMEAIHQTGLWAVRLLALTLAVTPLRLATRWPKLVSIRRILGVSVLAYAVLHVGLFAYDQHFAALHIASEIVKRLYLAIGFVALMLLCLLSGTSTDRMIARLGSRRWTRLHRAVYAIAALASVHFFMQSKLDVTQPTIMAGIFALLLGYRVLAASAGGDLSAAGVAALALGAATATALGEALWFAVSAGAPLALVLAANLDFSYMARPAWYVLAAGLVLFAARLSRPAFARRAPRVRRRALGDAKAPG
ncbi:Ferric reductase domain protein protein transmembrane component domain protein [Methylocella silvestris BL2]|uniref:Protein-methionine-sulfoxide reductase heme-binding subunit MsrQ n=1 Tax=Methylocella silvestris (strain DSM 15510 / CIP 108128 / LMG 27833 / NCIMB 13906 / BL2) TaxID=395965 RepID=B8EN18_METSB|nr:protein-methionine-sulfoxide reductase heme-binding subunit MsrQ [Methylocella silvestris]ACK49153.1 Ferric reductase domain protein protein transmembrane component domain protein [Methylocella silvestris BL2]